MASVNTNAAAITALRTLQQTNQQLDKTQDRVSTGYKIGQAKDNAAYWAISTSLKSDNKSLGTVKDALGLGASTVDVAYQGLNKAKDVLDEIKSKLTAATQDGLDRDTIQNEIKQLQDQLKSIASSSVFSGENWLMIDSGVNGFNSEKQVVASFSRDGSGAVSIGTIRVQTAQVALFDSSTSATAGGILDGKVSLTDQTTGRDLDLGTANTVGNRSAAGLTATTAAGVNGIGTAVVASVLGDAGTAAATTYAASNMTVTTGTAGDGLTITVSKGGVQVGSSFTAYVGSTVTAAGVNDAIKGAISSQVSSGALSGFTVGGTSGNIVLTNGTVENAGYTITVAAATKADGTANAGTYAMATSPAPTGYVAPAKATFTTGALTTSDYAVGDRITATVEVNGTRTTVTTAALTATGSADIATALDTALTGIADVSSPSSTVLKFDAAAGGLKTSFKLLDFKLTGSNGAVKTAANVPQGIQASFETSSFSPVAMDGDDNLYFKVKLNDDTSAKNVTINKELVDSALKNVAGHVSGQIASASDFKLVLDAALTKAGVTGLTTAVTNTDKITFSTAMTGVNANLVISDIAASAGADKISVNTIDISANALTAMGATTNDQIKGVLKSYIAVVNSALEKVKNAAASLGSVASRIDMQKSFVDTLMDTIDKGVGNLIDADMSEESTKLQALQVKQQLGVQALSIANQSSQNILSLFRTGN